MCNILPGLICFWKYVQKRVWKEHLCTLQVFLCELVSRLVRARTHTQLRGNIGKQWLREEEVPYLSQEG